MKQGMLGITLFCVVSLAVLAALPAAAADSQADQHASVAAKLAKMASPTLTEDPAIMKDLAKGLRSVEGILSAKYEPEDALLRVVFDPAKTTVESVQKALGEVLPDLTLKGVEDTKLEAKDCGKCPHASKCAKEAKQDPEKK